jgi:murein L,D-transpeptidase YcbB/YkuD
MSRYEKKTPRPVWNDQETERVFTAVLDAADERDLEKKAAKVAVEIGRYSEVRSKTTAQRNKANANVVLNRVWGIVTLDPHDSAYEPPLNVSRESLKLSWFERNVLHIVYFSKVHRKVKPTKSYLARLFRRSTTTAIEDWVKQREGFGLIERILQ